MKTTTTRIKNYSKLFASAIALLTLVFCFSIKSYAQQKEKLLGEKQFDIELTEVGKKKNNEPVKDQLLFRANKLSSTYMMREYVFTASAYTASVDSTSGTKVITFVSDSKNADGDMLKWNGTVTDEEMEGTVTLADKKGKLKTTYTFKGQQKKFKGK
jgi:hypothetical protein